VEEDLGILEPDVEIRTKFKSARHAQSGVRLCGPCGAGCGDAQLGSSRIPQSIDQRNKHRLPRKPLVLYPMEIGQIAMGPPEVLQLVMDARLAAGVLLGYCDQYLVSRKRAHTVQRLPAETNLDWTSWGYSEIHIAISATREANTCSMSLIESGIMGEPSRIDFEQICPFTEYSLSCRWRHDGRRSLSTLFNPGTHFDHRRSEATCPGSES
jgi:hypothetical protein